jgi:hypothetical protein
MERERARESERERARARERERQREREREAKGASDGANVLRFLLRRCVGVYVCVCVCVRHTGPERSMRDSPFRGDKEPPEAPFSKVPSRDFVWSVQ